MTFESQDELPTVPQSCGSTGWNPKKISPKMERLADLLMGAPSLKNGQLAEALGVTPQWVSTVRNSDSFQEYYGERRAAFEGQLIQDVVGEMEAKSFRLHNKLLDQLGEKAERSATTTRELLGIMDRVHRVLGIEKAEPKFLVVNNNQAGSGGDVVDRKLLQGAREQLTYGTVIERSPRVGGGSGEASKVVPAASERDSVREEGSDVPSGDVRR